MVTYSSILAWEIPWTGRPGKLQSMGLQRVGHAFVTEHEHLLIYIYIHTRLTLLNRYPVDLFLLFLVLTKLHCFLRYLITLD